MPGASRLAGPLTSAAIRGSWCKLTHSCSKQHGTLSVEWSIIDFESVTHLLWATLRYSDGSCFFSFPWKKWLFKCGTLQVLEVREKSPPNPNPDPNPNSYPNPYKLTRSFSAWQLTNWVLWYSSLGEPVCRRRWHSASPRSPSGSSRRLQWARSLRIKQLQHELLHHWLSLRGRGGGFCPWDLKKQNICYIHPTICIVPNPVVHSSELVRGVGLNGGVGKTKCHETTKSWFMTIDLNN